MTHDDQLAALFSILEKQTKALEDTQTQLTAVSTAFIGVLRALDEQPGLVPVIAREISVQAEKVAALYLGSTLSDEMGQRRAQVLQDLLPPNVRALVTQH